MMTHFRTNRNKIFISIERSKITHPGLSFSAIGLYCYVLARPEHEKELLECPSNKNMINELINAGLLEEVQNG